jgi:hypothetical protein
VNDDPGTHRSFPVKDDMPKLAVRTKLFGGYAEAVGEMARGADVRGRGWSASGQGAGGPTSIESWVPRLSPLENLP